MDKQKEFATRIFTAKTIILLLLTALGLTVAGCGNNNMVRIEENQLKLQALVEMNAHQISKATQRVEQNQKDLQNAMKTVRQTTQQLAVEIASAAAEHTKLQEIVRANTAQTSDKIAGMESKQQNLQTGIQDAQTSMTTVAADVAALGTNQTKLEGMIETNSQTLASKVKTLEQYQARLQSEIKNVVTITERVAADLAVVADAQAKFESATQNDMQLTAERIAANERKHLEQRNEIESIRDNALKVTHSVGALEKNILKLQEVLQSDMDNLADIIEVIGQGQIEFETTAEKDIRGLADSIRIIKKGQTSLREQAKIMRTNNQTMMKTLASTLEQLKTRVSSIAPPEQQPKIAKTKIAASKKPK